MFSPRTMTAAALLGAILSTVTVAQPAGGNPLARDSQAVAAGRELFLQSCAVCHGQDAKGGMAANLVRSRTVARSGDRELYRVILEGIPGTEMPPQPDLEPGQAWSLVSYLHSLARPGLQPPVPGNAAVGRAVFHSAGCARCHIVDGAGGFLGPPLDSISSRKTSGEIRRDILEPDAALAPGYRSVAARTEQGERIEGLLRNEDSFSLQILTPSGAYRLLERRDLQEIRKLDASSMPHDYADKLTGEQLQNLLAYLDRQRDPHIPFDRGFANY